MFWIWDIEPPRRLVFSNILNFNTGTAFGFGNFSRNPETFQVPIEFNEELIWGSLGLCIKNIFFEVETPYLQHSC